MEQNKSLLVTFKGYEIRKVEWEDIFYGVLFILLSVFFLYFISKIIKKIVIY